MGGEERRSQERRAERLADKRARRKGLGGSGDLPRDLPSGAIIAGVTLVKIRPDASREEERCRHYNTNVRFRLRCGPRGTQSRFAVVFLASCRPVAGAFLAVLRHGHSPASRGNGAALFVHAPDGAQHRSRLRLSKAGRRLGPSRAGCIEAFRSGRARPREVVSTPSAPWHPNFTRGDGAQWRSPSLLAGRDGGQADVLVYGCLLVDVRQPAPA